MDEESSMSSQSFDQENENLMDKENQRRGGRVSNDDDDAADEQQRYIFEQQQYQRSQFYEQQQAHRRPSTLDDDDDDEEERSPGTFESHDVPMDDELSSSDSKLVESVPDYLVEKIGKERWSGVNGHYNDKGEWKEWNEITTGYNSYSKEAVFILPYVSVDYQSLNISC